MTDARFAELLNRFGGRGLPIRITAETRIRSKEEMEEIAEWIKEVETTGGWKVRLEHGEKDN